jgi:hypothetical protein
MTTVGHPSTYDDKGGVTVFGCDQLMAHGFEDGSAATCTLPRVGGLPV